MSNYLIHYGIPGMKWGVRRYQNSDGTLTDRGRKRYGRLGSDKNNLRWVDKTAMRRSSTQIVYFGRKKPGANQQKILDKYKKEANNSKYEKELTKLDKEASKLAEEYKRAKEIGDEKTIKKLDDYAPEFYKKYQETALLNSSESLKIAKKYVKEMNTALVKDLDFEYVDLGASYLTDNRLGWDEHYIYNRAWFND